MNELIFALHSFFIMSALLLSLKWGKSALVTLAVFLAVLCNIFVMKQISLFSLNVTASDALAVGSVLAIGLLQEYFGESAAKKAVKLSFAMLFFFTAIAQIHLAYTPSIYDTTHNAFAQILGATPRIAAASLIAFYVMQRLNVFLLEYLKKKFVSVGFAVRIIIVGGFCQIVDTVLFGILGLYGIVHAIIHVMFMSFSIKMICLFFSAPFTAFSHKMIDRKAYD